MNAFRSLLAVLVLIGASLASAEQDTFFLGNGKAGYKIVRNRTTQVVNKYVKVTGFPDPKTIDVGSNADIGLGDGSGFEAEKLVLVLQTVGNNVGIENDTDLNLDSLSSGKVGRWEFARLSSVNKSSSKLHLNEKLVNTYDVGLTQVILVPEYASVYVEAGSTIKADAWNSSNFTGGVVAFLVRDSLGVDGTISADEAGFQGGTTTGTNCNNGNGGDAGSRGEGLDVSSVTNTTASKANGGGGGGCAGGGGGGGGGAGAGGLGGKAMLGGKGGAGTSWASYGTGTGANVFPWRLVLGGGGGHGQSGSAGGRGGGAIFIRAGTLFGTGKITADGESVASSSNGGGGGGAGGTIHLRVADSVQCFALSAKGGAGGATSGSDAGPGGGGGGGRILRQAANYCSATVVGGAPGSTMDPRGALKGFDGIYDFDSLPGPLTAPGDAVVFSVSDVQGGFVNVRKPTFLVKAPDQKNVHLFFDTGSKVGPLLDKTSDGYYRGVPTEELPDGTRRTVVAQVEYQGIWGLKSSPPFEFKVDATVPDTSFTSIQPPNPDKSSSARFVFSAFDALSGVVAFKCKLDTDAAFSACSKDMTFEGLNEGTRTLRVQAVDLAGNPRDLTLYQPAVYSWVIDVQAPSVPSVTDPRPSAFVKDARYPIAGTAEPNVKVLVYIDDAAAQEVLANGAGRWTYTPSSELSPGQHRVRASTKDAAKNESAFSSTVIFTVDTSVPSITFTYPGAGPVRDNPLVVLGETEPGSTLTIYLLDSSRQEIADTRRTVSAVAVEPGAWRYEVAAPLADGTYIVQATAKDAAGNSTPTPAELPFVLDRTPPNTTLSCPSRFTDDPTVYFAFGPDNGAVSYDCVLNEEFSTTPVACPGSLDKVTVTKTFADGTYTLMARARDQAGNMDPSPAVCTWTWDRTPPGPVDVIGPTKVTDSTLAVFHFNASDVDNRSGPVEFDCLLDSATVFTPCSNPYAITVSKNDHVLKVRARDLAGNVGPESVPYSWTVDTGLPVARITADAGAENPTNARSAIFQLALKAPITSRVAYFYILNNSTTDDLNAVEDGRPLFTRVDGNDKGEAVVTIPLPEGDLFTYTIRVIARDLEREINTPHELQESYRWTIDRVPPKVQIDGKPAMWERFKKASFVFSAPDEERVRGFLCAVSNCESSAEMKDCSGVVAGPRANYQILTGLEEGRNCINVWAVDSAGNQSEVHVSYEWNVDTVAPEPPVLDTTQPGALMVATRVPSVEGRAEPFADVAVLLDNPSETNKPVWVSANGNGRWKALIAQEVSDGSHTLRAWARDRAGNEGPEADPINLLVDAQSPARVIGGGVGCSSSGGAGSLLALLGLAQWLYRGRARRRA